MHPVMHTIALPTQSSFAPPRDHQPPGAWRRARAIAQAVRRRGRATDVAVLAAEPGGVPCAIEPQVVEPQAVEPVAVEPQVVEPRAVEPLRPAPRSAASPWCHGCGASEQVVACGRCCATACREHIIRLPDRTTVCVGCALVACGVRRKGHRPDAAAGRAWMRI
jgi:hypothetical protein